MEISEGMTGTLRAQEHGHQPLVYENHGIDSRYRQMAEVAPTMSARYGTGGNNVPLVEQEPVICITGNVIDLSARNFSFGEEIIESDGKLNFYLQADFDVDAAFGTFVCTDQNDDWLNIYANYDIEKDRLCDTLELNLCKGDGTEENWSYHLNAAEQEVLARKMEDYCQQQTGMSLHEYAQQLRESGSQTPEMQM